MSGLTRWGRRGGGLLAGTLLLPALAAGPAFAAEAPTKESVQAGDTAWLLISSALVFLMTAPGLALFYGGLVRRKNVLSVLMQCMMIVFLVSLQWILVGYSLAFGPDWHGLIGRLDWVGLRGVAHDTPHWDAALGLSYAGTVPHQAFAIFQMMFAVITPALIIGAFAERVRFGPFCLFTLLWATLVYDPVAHWMWGAGGLLGTLNPSGKGAMDFAGGIVVHVNAGVAALACAVFLGRRKGYPDKISPPHNLPFAVIGAGLLWFGWFGFNAGSALAAGGLATSAFLVTHTAAAVGGLTWALMDWIYLRRATMLGAITGAVAGLATITPASGFVSLGGAVVIGLLAGIVPWFFVSLLKPKLGYDDSLDAFGVHCIGGLLGTLATGLFATRLINPNGLDGALYGNPDQFGYQAKAVLIALAYSFIVTYVLLVAVNRVAALRACDHEEAVGLDLTQHREVAYTVID
jgi:Amt family ammonium transporter